jgi:hypothetical protein
MIASRGERLAGVFKVFQHVHKADDVESFLLFQCGGDKSRAYF